MEMIASDRKHAEEETIHGRLVLMAWMVHRMQNNAFPKLF
jgi:hypothetical protein